MSRLWAIVAPDGSYVLRHCERHPARSGHRSECKGHKVWELTREPRADLGEGIDPATGAFDFDLARVEAGIIAAIKAEAARRIEAISPDWRQRNDLRLPSPAGDERWAAIDAIRGWSNMMEQLLARAQQPGAVEFVLNGLKDDPA